MTNQVRFLQVSSSPEHLKFLYERLKARQFNISHSGMPSFAEHAAFVQNSPYREWLICVVSGRWIGSVYINHDNTIGLDLLPDEYHQVPTIVNQLKKKFQPLAGIKSVRSNNFLVNVASGNKKLIDNLVKMGAEHIQSTFRV